MEEKNSMLTIDLLTKINKNREKLFDSANKRIQNRLLQDEIDKKEQESELALQVGLNTERIANAIISLVYKILTEANQKKANINVATIDKILGKPYDDMIGETEPSYYEFDDEGLTIYLNYSYEGIDLDCWGATRFISSMVDKDYLQELLNKNGIEFDIIKYDYSDCATIIDIEVVIIKVKRYIKSNDKNYCKRYNM